MDREIDIERAWKDEEYRKSLTPEQLAQLPPNPGGDIELSEDELDDVSGGIYGIRIQTMTQCSTYTAPVLCLKA